MCNECLEKQPSNPFFMDSYLFIQFPGYGIVLFTLLLSMSGTHVRLHRAHDQIHIYIGENSSQQSRQSDNIIVDGMLLLI